MRPNATKAEALLERSLPSRRDEAWKWTDVRKGLSDKAVGLIKAGLPSFSLPDGVSVSEQSNDALDTDTPMASLARQFGGSVWVIDVPAGMKAERPLVIDALSHGHFRIRVNLGEGASLSVIEYHNGQENSFANLDMTFDLQARASLRRVIMQMDPEAVVRTATTHMTAWGGAKIEQYALAFGGALCRLETRLAIMGQDVEALINGAYLLGGDRHCDMTSYIDLAAPDGLIRQSVKGVANDSARGVFQGKFHVRRPAQKTDAEMRHDALMLSDDAEVRAKPELEIYADDVACAHGNTVGALDETALFYMRQRGIPVSEAKALLTQAFINEVFDDLDDTELQESLMDQVRIWLGAAL